LISDPLLARMKFETDSLPLVNEAANFQKTGIRVIEVNFPVIEVALFWKMKQREIMLRIIADEYDYLPVQAYWINEGGEALLSGQGFIPQGIGFQTEGGNPLEVPRSWLCFRGWREYHECHLEVLWSAIRNLSQYRIPGLITQLYSDLNRAEVQAV